MATDQPSLTLQLARHALPLAAVLAVYTAIAHRPGAFWTYWPAACLFVMIASAAIAGALHLYSSDRAMGKYVKRVIVSAWVVGGLLFVGPLTSALKSGSPAHSETVADGSSETALGQTPTASSCGYEELEARVNRIARDAAPSDSGPERAEAKYFAGVDLEGAFRQLGVRDKRVIAEIVDFSSDASVTERRARLGRVRAAFKYIESESDACVVKWVHREFFSELSVAAVAKQFGVDAD